MTVMDGFLPSTCFKEEFHEPIGFEHIIPSNGHQKSRHPQMPPKPVEDYRFFVALVMVEDGSIQVRSSQELKRFRGAILEDSHHRFKEVYSDYIEQPGTSKRHRSARQSPATFAPRDPQFSHCSRKSVKRRHAGNFRGTNQPFLMRPELNLDVKQPIQSGRQLQIRVDDEQAQEKWFSDAFKAVQQVGCRTIAKVWIKKIHPKKQSTHPYNGGFPRDQQADPDRTRPPYWPDNVIHKEPDHIDRNARTALLVHLIMHTPQDQIKSPYDSETKIFANDLLLALEEKRNDFKADRWEIIREIIRVREQLEMFGDGGFDDDTTIHVPDFSERSARGDTDGEGEDNDLPAPEPANTGHPLEDGQENRNGNTTLASNVSSPVQSDRNTNPQIGQYQPNLASHDNERDVLDHSSAHDPTSTIQSTSHSFSNDSVGANSSPVVIGPNSFAAQSKRDRPGHRLQQLRVPQHVNGFQNSNNRQHEDLLVQHWIPDESPASYMPPGYAIENLHTPMQMSPQHYRMSEHGLMHDDLHEITMNSGLPMQFDGFPPHSRPLPARALSTPHPMMLDHGIHGTHGLGVMQPTFYAG